MCNENSGIKRNCHDKELKQYGGSRGSADGNNMESADNLKQSADFNQENEDESAVEGTIDEADTIKNDDEQCSSQKIKSLGTQYESPEKNNEILREARQPQSLIQKNEHDFPVAVHHNRLMNMSSPTRKDDLPKEVQQSCQNESEKYFKDLAQKMQDPPFKSQ